MREDFFGDEVAEHYDDDVADLATPQVLDPMVDLLAELAGDGGTAFEMGIGTGRVALPLAARGIAVHGVDLSEAMVRRLRAKPGGDAIPVTIGDFAGVDVGRTFRLAYLVFNTISNLTAQHDQVDCFCTAARHLEPGGHFVIENGVPSLQRLPAGERFRPFDVSPRHVGIDEFDLVTQRLWSHHWTFADGRVRQASVPLRFTWPAELDLMARIAGLQPAARYGDWDRSPFTADSRKHVSVWRKPEQ